MSEKEILTQSQLLRGGEHHCLKKPCSENLQIIHFLSPRTGDWSAPVPGWLGVLVASFPGDAEHALTPFAEDSALGRDVQVFCSTSLEFK